MALLKPKVKPKPIAKQDSPNCTSCCFFRLVGIYAKYGEGKCKRYPPNDRGLNPVVNKFHWCGEFQEK